MVGTSPTSDLLYVIALLAGTLWHFVKVAGWPQVLSIMHYINNSHRTWNPGRSDSLRYRANARTYVATEPSSTNVCSGMLAKACF